MEDFAKSEKRALGLAVPGDELGPYIPVIYPASLLPKKDTSAAMSAGRVWRGMAKDLAH